MSLVNNIEFLRRLPKLNGIYGFGDFERNLRPGQRSPLVETTGFGSNPGGLRMFSRRLVHPCEALRFCIADAAAAAV